jgi:hypothetical protein
MRRFYSSQSEKRTTKPAPALRREIGRIVFDCLLEGATREQAEQKLRDAGATPAEMFTALRRYDTGLASVVMEGRR